MRRPGIAEKFRKRRWRENFLVENDRIAEFQNAETKKKAEDQRADVGCGDCFSGRHCRKFVRN